MVQQRVQVFPLDPAGVLGFVDEKVAKTAAQTLQEVLAVLLHQFFVNQTVELGQRLHSALHTHGLVRHRQGLKHPRGKGVFGKKARAQAAGIGGFDGLKSVGQSRFGAHCVQQRFVGGVGFFGIPQVGRRAAQHFQHRVRRFLFVARLGRFAEPLGDGAIAEFLVGNAGGLNGGARLRRCAPNARIRLRHFRPQLQRPGLHAFHRHLRQGLPMRPTALPAQMFGYGFQGARGVPALLVLQIGPHVGLQQGRQFRIHAHLIQHALHRLLLQEFLVQLHGETVGHPQIVAERLDQAQGKFVQRLDGNGAVVVEGFSEGHLGFALNFLGGPIAFRRQLLPHGFPLAPVFRSPDQIFQHGQHALAHFAGGFVGEGHGQDASRQDAAQRQVHVFVHQPVGLSGAGTGLKHAERLRSLGKRGGCAGSAGGGCHDKTVGCGLVSQIYRFGTVSAPTFVITFHRTLTF